ncbi:hypothetical protein V6N13_110054 [Hibiscus sabdariffa]|uniref:Uncharacterized protein n=2 Tax=Hibiscus sabdariffa TaxID=183260 RepID=A0ABR2A434_9ROSI
MVTAKLSSDPNINAGDWPPNLVKNLYLLTPNEINKICRQILFLSYIWDQRPVRAYGSTSINNNIQEVRSSSIPKFGLNPISYVEKLVEMNVSPKSTKVFGSRDSALVENDPDINMMNQGGLRKLL